jgi:hypothetical protein
VVLRLGRGEVGGEKVVFSGDILQKDGHAVDLPMVHLVSLRDDVDELICVLLGDIDLL